jgi:hypothetical protein
LAVLLVAQAAGAAESVRVTGDHVNLRSGPSTNSRIVSTVDKGTVLEVLGRETGWIRVTAPRGGGTAYISASLCEPVVSAPPVVSQPATTTPAPSATPTRSGGSSREPLRFGGHASWANEGIDFGLGARASTGLPGISHLGALVAFDYFFGARSSLNAAGVEVDASGHSIQLGVFPTYSFDVAGVHGYAGAGLSYFRVSVSTSVTTGGQTVEGSASASSTSLGIVAGARFKERFFGELRYQFGDANHLTLSAGVLF